MNVSQSVRDFFGAIRSGKPGTQTNPGVPQYYDRPILPKWDSDGKDSKPSSNRFQKGSKLAVAAAALSALSAGAVKAQSPVQPSCTTIIPGWTICLPTLGPFPTPTPIQPPVFPPIPPLPAPIFPVANGTIVPNPNGSLTQVTSGGFRLDVSNNRSNAGNVRLQSPDGQVNVTETGNPNGPIETVTAPSSAAISGAELHWTADVRGFDLGDGSVAVLHANRAGKITGGEIFDGSVETAFAIGPKGAAVTGVSYNPLKTAQDESMADRRNRVVFGQAFNFFGGTYDTFYPAP